MVNIIKLVNFIYKLKIINHYQCLTILPSKNLAIKTVDNSIIAFFKVIDSQLFNKMQKFFTIKKL